MAGKNGDNLPGVADCLAIMARHRLPEHIVRHSQAVCVLALHMSRLLIGQGYQLDLRLVRAAALLHDITKHHSFHRPLDHALTGAKVLKKLGYTEVAEIVRQHVRLSASRPPGRITEAEIVSYADKRVVNDQVTTLTDRLKYIRERYGRSKEALVWIDKFASMAFELESDIFAVLPGDPDQLLSVDIEKEIPKLCQ